MKYEGSHILESGEVLNIIANDLIFIKKLIETTMGENFNGWESVYINEYGFFNQWKGQWLFYLSKKEWVYTEIKSNYLKWDSAWKPVRWVMHYFAESDKKFNKRISDLIKIEKLKNFR